MEDEDDAFLQVEDFLEDVSIACEVPVPNCSEIHILAVIHALFSGFAIRANFKRTFALSLSSRYRRIINPLDSSPHSFLSRIF